MSRPAPCPSCVLLGMCVRDGMPACADLIEWRREQTEREDDEGHRATELRERHEAKMREADRRDRTGPNH